MVKKTKEEQLNEAIAILKKHGNEENVDEAIRQIQEAKKQLHENRQKVRKKISRSRIFRQITKNMRTWQLLGGFLALFLVIAIVLYFVEPGIHSVGDSLWYCFVTTTTIGYGELVATTILGRICVTILSLYAIFITAILTSVLVAYHNQVAREQEEGSLMILMDQLEHLPELSKEELAELSEQVKKYRD